MQYYHGRPNLLAKASVVASSYVDCGFELLQSTKLVKQTSDYEVHVKYCEVKHEFKVDSVVSTTDVQSCTRKH